MSESVNESTDSTQNNKPVIKVEKVRVSIIPLLLSLLALALIGYIIYQGIINIRELRNQANLGYQQNQQIRHLMLQNQQLTSKLDQFYAVQSDLKNQVQQLNPTQSSLIVYQLNSLLAGANQSLLLYHDYAGAVKQLNYARQILNTSDDPLFTELKISLVTDLDSLQAQNNFDNTMLAAQLDDAYQNINQLNTVTPVAIKSSIKNDAGIWEKFMVNLKSSLLGMIKIVETNHNTSQIMFHENETILRQHLQLDILNARQGLLTHNQQLWTTSVNDALSIVQNFFITDLSSQKELTILSELQKVKFNANEVNLDRTLQALTKLNSK